LVVLITLSWSQPGKAAPTLADADPERAADILWKDGEIISSAKLSPSPCLGYGKTCQRSKDCCGFLKCSWMYRCNGV